MAIFADTSFFYAGLVARDVHHLEVSDLLTQIAGRTVATTNHIVGECWTLLARRWGHSIATQFLDRLEHSGVFETHHVSELTEQSALVWLRRHDEREYSFVDATSFAFMRENRITEALAFDGDFSAAGFIELRP